MRSSDQKYVGALMQQIALACQTVNVPLPLQEVTTTFLSLAVQSLSASFGIVFLFDEAQRILRVETCVPQLPESIETVYLDPPTWEMLQAVIVSGTRAEIGAFVLQQVQISQRWQYQSVLSAPLLHHSAFLGLFACYFQGGYQSLALHQTFLDILTDILALELRRRQFDVLVSHNRVALIEAFFDNLAHPQRGDRKTLQYQANFLEIDLTRPYTVIILEIGIIDADGGYGKPEESKTRTRQVSFARINEQVQHHLTQAFPGSIVHGQDAVLIGLLHSLPDKHISLKTRLHELAHQLREQYARHSMLIRLSIGISDTISPMRDYQHGFVEASQALQASKVYQTNGGAVHFNEIMLYRSLHEIPELTRYLSSYEKHIEQLAEHDRAEGKDRLLNTLEAFLVTGSIRKAQTYLLAQYDESVSVSAVQKRLGRIERVLTIRLFGEDQAQIRIDLYVAIKAYKLHRQG